MTTLPFEIIVENKQECVVIHDKNLKDILCKMKEFQKISELYVFNRMMAIPLSKIKKSFQMLDGLSTNKSDESDESEPEEEEKKVEECPAFVQFCEKMRKHFTAESNEFDKLLSKGKVTFAMLENLFGQGKDICCREKKIGFFSEKFGARIFSTEYRQSAFGNYFCIHFQVVEGNGECFYYQKRFENIFEFDDAVDISSLSVQLLDEPTRNSFIERGQRIETLTKNHHYLTFKGNMIVRSEHGNYVKHRADGRVMIDLFRFYQFNPEEGYFDDSAKITLDNLKSEHHWNMLPFVSGFSFAEKCWGYFPVDQFSPVVFYPEIFENLVIDPQTKTLIKALVEHKDSGMAQSMSEVKGKNLGLIFLLHGCPGVGKTLTAESVAELLHRPLYSIGIGELGTELVQMETRLKQILELGEGWNGVLLLDEADVFMEVRDTNQIERNAMISVFLRLLEYQNSVLFLTTNRVKNFDPAFKSRISLAICYENLLIK
jgi:hypothetical protein